MYNHLLPILDCQYKLLINIRLLLDVKHLPTCEGQESFGFYLNNFDGGVSVCPGPFKDLEFIVLIEDSTHECYTRACTYMRWDFKSI